MIDSIKAAIVEVRYVLESVDKHDDPTVYAAAERALQILEAVMKQEVSK